MDFGIAGVAAITVICYLGGMACKTTEKVKDEAQNHFTPLNLEGTPEELNAGFITAISNPVRKVSGMLKNMADFEEKTEKAAAESKALKEKNDKVNKMIKDAEALEKDKPKEALTAYNKVLELDKYNQKIISKIAALQEKTMQGNLFAAESDSTATVKEADIQPVVPQYGLSAEIEPVAGNNTTGAAVSAVDMFEQVLKNNEPVAQEKKSADAAPAMGGMTPEMLAQFQQFMAFQQQQGNNNNQ